MKLTNILNLQQFKKTGIKDFKNNLKRQKKRKKIFDERLSENMDLISTEIFKSDSYFVMLDKLIKELEKRKESYDHLLENYKFFFKPTTLSVADVYMYAARLQKEYLNDLEPSFINECLHFRGHLKSIGSDAPNTIQDMCAFIRQKHIVNIYPYIDISLRMLLCTPISNCSTERSFSALKRVKSYLRSCSKENRLNSLAMMTVEADLTSKIDYNGVIEEFASLKCRKKC